MKKKLIALSSFCLLVTIIVLSCSKGGGSSSQSNCKLAGYVQGTDTASDTTNTFQFDNNNRIKSIITKLGVEIDTNYVTYDANGNLTQFYYTSGGTVYGNTFIYTGSLLTAISSNYNGQGASYTITYGSNNLPVSISTTFSGITSTDSIQFNSNGDVSSVKEFSNGTLTTQISCQYTSTANSLKQLALINYLNTLGMDELIYVGSDAVADFIVKYYSTHLISSATSTGSNAGSVAYTYGFNTSSQVSLYKATLSYGTFTYNFDYDCN